MFSKKQELLFKSLEMHKIAEKSFLDHVILFFQKFIFILPLKQNPKDYAKP